MAQPDYNAMIDTIWGGSSVDLAGLFPLVAAASNVIVGSNPPFSATDFFSFYPQFGGMPAVATGTVTAGQEAVAALNIADDAPVRVGNYVTGIGIAPGTTVATYTPPDGDTAATMTLSAPATSSGTPVAITIYVAPLIPAVVLNAYVYLAVNSIFFDRWQELWFAAVCAFIAHYCTLWAQGNQRPSSNLAQLAAAGIARGIQTSKSADGVSVGYTALDFDGWGAYALTTYGQEFATWAKIIGSASMLLY